MSREGIEYEHGVEVWHQGIKFEMEDFSFVEGDDNKGSLRRQ